MLWSSVRTAWGVALLAAGFLVSGCAGGPPTVAAGPCADADLAVYFGENSAELTGPARAMIADAGRQAARCHVREVQVVGLADYRGPADANLALSRKRAEATAKALESAGLPPPSFAVTAEGETGAVAAPGVAEPMHRKAEVFIRYVR
jgi:outer membrane protein OmpA-like peptidoglycan-associated protein